MSETETLIGQRPAETFLARAVARNRVSHAYLFLGPPHSGKTTAARLFARAVNCARQPAARQPAARSEETPGGLSSWRLSPCGVCENCRRIAAGTHPEVLEVRPDSKTGQDISIDQAREIRANAALRPKLGARRMYLIPQAEAFNESSANALLKTLEEPSDSVALVLCAPSPSQVLPTIRSRCQVVRFGLAPAEELAGALAERGADLERAAVLARASGGRPGLALTWLENPAVLEQRAQVLDLFTEALAAAPHATRNLAVGARSLRLAESLRALISNEKPEKPKRPPRGAKGAEKVVDREEPKEEAPPRPAKLLHHDNLETGLTLLRDVLLLTGGADPALAQNQDRLPMLTEAADRLSPHAALARVEAVREAQQLLERNVAPQLVLERMFWALIAGPLTQRARLFEPE